MGLQEEEEQKRAEKKEREEKRMEREREELRRIQEREKAQKDLVRKQKEQVSRRHWSPLPRPVILLLLGAGATPVRGEGAEECGQGGEGAGGELFPWHVAYNVFCLVGDGEAQSVGGGCEEGLVALEAGQGAVARRHVRSPQEAGQHRRRRLRHQPIVSPSVTVFSRLIPF